MKRIDRIIGFTTAMLLCVALAFCQEGRQSENTVPAQQSLPPADGGFVSSNGNLTHLVVCGPAGDFKPHTFDAYYSLCNQPFLASGARWMFSKIQKVDGKNLLLSLTDNPEKMREAIESLPQLEYIRTERLTEEMFEEHLKPWTQPTQFPAPSWQPMKNFENDAKPIPNGLLKSIQEKRRAIQSAEYTVRWITQDENETETCKTAFRFQGKNQWFADVSEIMQSKVFQTGCDGKTEWSFSDSAMIGIHYTTRNFADIKEIDLSFLDPFGFLDESGESLEETIKKYNIRYFGEEEIAGKKWHLFGYGFQQNDEKHKDTTRIEIALDTETLLPATTRIQSDFSFDLGDKTMSNSMKMTLIYDIVSTNKELPDTAFLPSKTEGTEPTLKEKPDEGYDRFFVRIDDGSGGRMSVRSDGQLGQRGMSSSGLN